MQTALQQSEKIVTHDFIGGGNVVSWSLVHANSSRTIRKIVAHDFIGGRNVVSWSLVHANSCRTIRKDCYTRLYQRGECNLMESASTRLGGTGISTQGRHPLKNRCKAKSRGSGGKSKME